jgi:ADP-ribosylglycohydrolase
MHIDSAAVRARNSLLAGAAGEIAALAALQLEQPALFPTLARQPWMFRLALATCESAVRDGGRVDAERLASVLVEWLQAGRLLHLDSETARAVAVLPSTPAPPDGADDKRARSGSASAAVRVGPLAFLLDPSRAADREALRAAVRLTHDEEEVHAAAVALVIAMRHVIRRARVPHDLAASIASELPASRVRERLTDGARAREDAAARPVGVPGHAADAVAAGIIAASRHPDDLDAAYRTAVAQSGDEAGAVVAGFLLGGAGCPAEGRLDGQLGRDLIEAVLEPFAQLVDTASV